MTPVIAAILAANGTFLGTPLTFALNAKDPTADAVFLAGGFASITFETDGDLTPTGSQSTPVGVNDYVLPMTAGVGSRCEVKYTNDSGDTENISGLTAGVWTAITTAREFGMSQPGIGLRVGTLTITVREILKPSNTASQTLEFSAATNPI